MNYKLWYYEVKKPGGSNFDHADLQNPLRSQLIKPKATGNGITLMCLSGNINSLVKLTEMRKLLLLAAYVLMCKATFSQTKSAEFLLEKSKKQRTTAWILLATGAAGILTGLLIEAPHRGTGNSQSLTGGLIEVGGIISTLSSVPFFISSRRNKKRATTLTIGRQRIPLPRKNLIVEKLLPTISLKISLND